MRVNGSRAVAVDVAVDRVVSVAGDVDALRRHGRVVVDGLAVGPGRLELRIIGDRPEDAPRLVNRLVGPDVVRT